MGKFHQRVQYPTRGCRKPLLMRRQCDVLYRITLMNELNEALDKVINKYKEKGFELKVGRGKNDKFEDYHIMNFFREGKKTLQTDLE
ncbi:hypothetical protein [Saccharolobus islandicus]|uniref:hypothetical protein n=1 Tax=Saccharolobus islandicus TaxID=43080 RepID=UPI00142EBA56|nr:hypothetical protein [Sulfolobus islandicus]